MLRFNHPFKKGKLYPSDDTMMNRDQERILLVCSFDASYVSSSNTMPFVIQENFPKIIKRDFVMVCHIPPFRKAKRQPLPILSPIPFKNMEFRDGIELSRHVKCNHHKQKGTCICMWLHTCKRQAWILTFCCLKMALCLQAKLLLLPVCRQMTERGHYIESNILRLDSIVFQVKFLPS